jgi:hypothetical protein
MIQKLDNHSMQPKNELNSVRCSSCAAFNHALEKVAKRFRTVWTNGLRGMLAVVLICAATMFVSLTIVSGAAVSAGVDDAPIAKMDDVKFRHWYARWEQYVVTAARNRFCDKETGEEIGWLISPFLSAFYYGYLIKGDQRWAGLLVECTDSWIKRATKEPDGFPGWPKKGAAGTPIDNLDELNTDSMLGEAMALRSIVLMSIEILKTPALKAKYGDKAESYIRLSELIFEKWDKRGAWRDSGDGGLITVVLPLGIDEKTLAWTDGYDSEKLRRAGFSHPNNKANLVACWLLAMFDATQKQIYRERAEKWFKLMKSRMSTNADGTYQIWSYWSPAGAWDYKYFVKPKHWIGIHPNPGYYSIDVEAIVSAYTHGVVFTKKDIDRLVKTALAEKRFWTALVPYDRAIQNELESTLQPDSWNGLGTTPWYLALQARLNATDR